MQYFITHTFNHMQYFITCSFIKIRIIRFDVLYGPTVEAPVATHLSPSLKAECRHDQSEFRDKNIVIRSK